MLNAFTVDLEDWFQGLTSTNRRVDLWPMLESRVEAATDCLLGILAEHGVSATFFVLGYVADQHPGLIQRIRAAGHEIGLHGYYHRFVSRMSADEFAAELDRGMVAVRRASGRDPIGHRAPYFSIDGSTPWAFDVLAARGLRYDSSVFPVRTTLYGFPEAPRFPYRVHGGALMEFPVSTVRAGGRTWPIAGGFYLRALPYAAVSRAIRSLNAEGRPAIMYMHPWELDTGQRYGQVTPRERITHYYGRGRLEGKLRRLLAEFRFGPLAAFLDGGWAA
jgi:polysaccharide deacetylase family protein (PEP-CTERM system associated)